MTGPEPAHPHGGARAALAGDNLNLPNLITAARILLAPAFIVLLALDAGADGALRWVAAALFVVAIATDGVDGAIARRTGTVTELGKLLDPIADKVLVGSALVMLTVLGELPWWVTALILLREIGITVYRFLVISDGVVAASRGGKLKTVFQAVAISLALFPLWVPFGGWVFWLDGVIMTIAVVLTVATGLDYLRQAWRARRAGGPR